jgi:anthranilate synthase component 1
MLTRTSARGRAVQQRLREPLDPLAAYAAVVRCGHETALFESPEVATVLMANAAVRVECRGSAITLDALSGNGRSLLNMLKAELCGFVQSATAKQLVLRIDPPAELDALRRLEAPCPLDAIRSALRCAMPPGEEAFAALALGIVAFDFALVGEDVRGNAEDPLGFPDYLFWIPESLLLFENGHTRLICAAFGDDDEDRAAANYNDAVERLTALAAIATQAPPFRAPLLGAAAEARTDLGDEAFIEVVERLKEDIRAGEIYQVVPSRTFSAPCPDPLRAFAALRALEPGSYHFHVAGRDFTLFGASPEISVRVTARRVEVRPIAGTRPRGATADLDNRLEAELRLDAKECAEHMMLVDLARNDVGRISAPGTRHVARLMSVERYARVMHMVSSVVGTLADGLDALHALAACLNVGTLTGAPKIRASQLLREHERTKRGPYGGAIGWVNVSGDLDTSVVIRSAFVRDGIAHVRAGAGVVFDSDPRAEAGETRRKASAVLSVLGAGA